MKILVVGPGGREHALAAKLATEAGVSQVLVAPGNAGMASTPNLHCEAVKANDGHGLLELCRRENPGLVVIGPEGPLAAGVGDQLSAAGFRVFGPTAAAARLESSKIFAKQLMRERGVPTARAHAYSSCEEALAGLSQWNVEAGVAIKVDGLASGKGVRVTNDCNDARAAVEDFMINPQSKVKGQRLLVEEQLKGQEVSAFYLCDGTHFHLLGLACDYKRLGDGGLGPNTGGMGAVAPPRALHPSLPPGLEETLSTKVVAPVLAEMHRRDHPFAGMLFVGLMVCDDGPRVLEFNVRFGDPETQALMPLLESDLHPYLLACVEGTLAQLPPPTLKKQTAVHIVLASGGYPDTGQTPLSLGHPITYRGGNWPGELPAKLQVPHIHHFFAGVSGSAENLINNGGRVLGITATGDDLQQARTRAYAEVDKIHFEGAQWRGDIGR